MDRITANAFGIWVRAERKRQGLSQKNLALRAGIRQSTLSHIENNKRLGNIDTWNRIVDGLGRQVFIIV
jgi:transcriptional regulator with XRE-family HTH domain